MELNAFCTNLRYNITSQKEMERFKMNEFSVIAYETLINFGTL